MSAGNIAAQTARICVAAVVVVIAGCASTPKPVAVTSSGVPAVVVQAMGTDGLRVVFSSNCSGFTNAVILTSTNASFAGRRAVMTTYVSKESTRHLILMFYPDTNETQTHTFVTVRLAEAEGPDISEPGAHKSKAFLDSHYVGHKVYVNATQLCPQGCMVGTVCTRSGENIGQALVNVGLAKAPKSPRSPCTSHNDSSMLPGYSYNVIDSVVEGKAVGIVGDMPAEKPTPPPAAAAPAKDKESAETPVKDEVATPLPADEKESDETPAAEESK